MADFSFRRSERLKSRKLIQQLFREGRSLVQFPLRLVWMPVAEPRSASPVQFAATVPRKRFRRAVQRNRLRRRIKEAYRLHKHELHARVPAGRQVACMAIYLSPEPLAYAEIERAMVAALRRAGKKIGADTEPANPPPNS